MSWAAPTLVAIAWIGWSCALAAVWALRRRMELVADAEHELRGAATAIGLRTDAELALQLARMSAALADLAEARGAEPAAPPDLEAGRLAQVLGNVVANAAEHGVGPVEVRAAPHRLELRNRDRPAASRRSGRGRGIAIAKRAARELGGSVSIESRNGYTRAIVELPTGEEEGGRRAA